jgi:hypothetical protein
MGKSYKSDYGTTSPSTKSWQRSCNKKQRAKTRAILYNNDIEEIDIIEWPDAHRVFDEPDELVGIHMMKHWDWPEF